MEDSLPNGTLDRRYAGIILLGKEWRSEEVIILSSECVDHVDCFFLWLLGLVLPPSLVVLLLGYCCTFGLVWHLWMSRRLQDAVLERKLLLSILDCEADLGTVRVDDGICGA